MPLTKTITWDTVASTTVPGLTIGKVTRTLLGDHRGSFIPVPGRAGDWYFRERRGRRKITVECFIEASTVTARRDAMEALADWLDVEAEAKLVISDEPTVYYMGVTQSFPDPDEWRDVATFELEWLVQPYSNDAATTTETWVADADHIHTWNPALKTFNYPVISIQPTNGTLLGFNLITNGETLSYVGSITSGQTVTINSIAPIVTLGVNLDTELTGAYDLSGVFMTGIRGAFPELIPSGNNTVTFVRTAGTATAITITVVFRRQYRR